MLSLDLRSVRRLVLAVAVAGLSVSTGADAARITDALYAFDGREPGGDASAVAFDRAGNLYVRDVAGALGAGSIIQLMPPAPGTHTRRWQDSDLYDFGAVDGDGALPTGAVLADASGNLFGATYWGGVPGCAANQGCGTIYELSPPAAGQTTWTETVLYRFTGGADGGYPQGGLIADPQGNLYGTTQINASATCGASCSVVFELKRPQSSGADWGFKVIYGPVPGVWFIGGLARNSAGKLYGLTSLGTAYELTPPTAAGAAWTEADIAHVADPNFGAPTGSLTLDAKGNLYGVTSTGNGSRAWSLFELRAPGKRNGWKAIALARFTGKTSLIDGWSPNSRLAVDAAGNVYGTTLYGGPNVFQTIQGPGPAWGAGVAFERAADGTYSVLYSFSKQNVAIGAFNPGPPVIDAAGDLYGPSVQTVWKIRAP